MSANASDRTGDEDVSVVGAGIVGMTTAVFLELEGYSTRVYAERVPYSDGGTSETPSLTTEYAAASVIPVHVDEDDDDLAGMVEVSDVFYDRIEDGETVRRQDNIEMFERGAIDNVGIEPEHTDSLRGYRSLDGYDGVVPGDDVEGYVHEIHFVEMPRYFPALVDLYEDEGGDVVRTRVERDEIGGLGGDVVVNATGYGNLFGDDAVVAKRGHLVHVDTSSEGRVRGSDGEPFSYTCHLADGDGNDPFVYAYPRGDTLVLGGSCQEGREVDGEWTGEDADDTVEVGGVEVPRRIRDVNRRLVREKSGVDIADYPMVGRYGYRPFRRGGIRIEREGFDGKDVVHNYGHGGAGVTLSWYSANRVYNLITGESGFDYDALDGVDLGARVRT